MSAVPAHWDAVARAVLIRNQCQGDTLTRTLILGNGDVRDLLDARAKVAETGCDGVMLGRAIYGNPWLFSERETSPSPSEKIQALIEHLVLFQELLEETTNYAVMKKHFKAYISGWDNAKELRIRLMETNTPEEALALLRV
jgi:tRNA-dihydrouridine synthase